MKGKSRCCEDAPNRHLLSLSTVHLPFPLRLFKWANHRSDAERFAAVWRVDGAVVRCRGRRQVIMPMERAA
jgi:hypothetical protein